MITARQTVPDPDDLISIARIARPQGRSGEVVADVLTDFPDRFAKLKTAYIKRPGGVIGIAQIERARPHKKRVVLKISGCDSIDQADEFRDSLVMITREELTKLPEDTYYDFDLVGCDVEFADGAPLGKVLAVQGFGAAPLLSVRDLEGRDHLIPLALSICIEIDVEKKRIRIDPPEGLLEL
ncbi:MAG: 16S rRNA processing protein RimM [Acidobacteria bacterium]|nr:16S rRNA processing protein RimM [Acidobacteriota bacterium]